MKSDFMLAINQLSTERKLSREVVLEAVEAALISAYRRNFGAAGNIEASIEPSTGEVRIFATKEVVENVQDSKVEVSLPEARQENPDARIGDSIRVEVTPRDFGRIAAQTAKQVILQRIREAERDVLFSNLADKAGEIAHGSVQSVEYHTGDIIVNIDGAEALLPAREQVPGERYRRGARLRAYVLDVRKGNRGPQITLSRRSPAFLGRLLELEVPEIFSGAVEIKAIAREAGSRSKVAVRATQEGVDPVGSCVGVRGGRIQNVVNELLGEKIDVVEWSSEVATFIANSLSPAKVMNVRLEDHPDSGKTATVIVPDRQLSLAIGKEGQNARLAAKLTGWRIDIKSATETAEETLGRYQPPALSPDEMDLLSLAEAILREQKEEGFSESELSIIQAAVQEEIASVPWPASPAEALSGVDALTAPISEAETGEEGLPAHIAPPGSAGDAKTAETESLLAAAAREQTLTEPEAAGAEERLEEEEETLPPFDDDSVGASIGWVATEPSPEFTYELIEEMMPIEPDWLEDELEEDEVRPIAPKKKKKKKTRSGHGQDQDVDIWSPRGGKTKW